MSIECVICVPARDEEHHLPHLLAALASQELQPNETLRVVVVANNCADSTAQVARSFGHALPKIRLRIREQEWPDGIANVGLARGSAMAAGMAWLREEAGDGILISTDADAIPPPHWLRAIRRGFRDGAEVVGGEIRIDERGQPPLPTWLRAAQAQVTTYWAAVRDLADAIDPLPHDPPERHGDHTGASLAITVDAYQAAGGVPPIASQEDISLVRAVELRGGRVRHPNSVWTEVSAREAGRAEGGMANELRRWRRLAESGEPHLVPAGDYWHEIFRRRRTLRGMYQQGSFRAEAGLSAADLLLIARGSVNDIAFVAACEEIVPASKTTTAEIGLATRGLQAMLTTSAVARSQPVTACTSI